MDLKCLLNSKLKKQKSTKNELPNQDVTALAEKHYLDWGGSLCRNSHTDSDTSGRVTEIPRFYHKLPSPDDILRIKLREESRSLFLQRRNKELSDDADVRHLSTLLEENHTHSVSCDGQKVINYEDFVKVSNLIEPKCKIYFQPSTFCKLISKDCYGSVPILNFHNYTLRKMWLYQTRIGLSLYDFTGLGYLDETHLESYILDLIPTLFKPEDLGKSFYNFYVCTVVRKFFFFLDPLHTGRVKIQDILSCSFLDDFIELREEKIPKEIQEKNWFSVPSTMRVYGMYLNLDKDHDGMLTREELRNYGMGTLTKVFIERVFQECLTYENKMDYKNYLNFVLAMENRREPQALHYFFKILDIRKKGYIDSFAINYFFRYIHQEASEVDRTTFDVIDEIFDMVKPVDPSKITLSDLIQSGQGHVVVSILVDVNAFWSYETKEPIPADAFAGYTEV